MTTTDDLDDFILHNCDCTKNDLSNISSNNALSSSNFNLFHLNIRSCNKNLDEVLIFLEQTKIDFPILMLSETWLNTNDSCINITNYSSFHSTRPNKKGGGTSIFINNKFNAEPIPSMSINNDIIECVGVKINYCRNNFNFICVYRPPSASLDQFNELFMDLLDDIPNNESNFIAGDFNVDILSPNPSNAIISFKEMFSSKFYFPLINRPTRITGTRRSCIDLIFANTLLPTSSGTLDTRTSDHLAVFSTVPINNYKPNDKYELKFRDHTMDNLIKFRNQLENQLASFDAYNKFSIDDRTSIFMNLLEKVYDESFPIMTKRISYKRLLSPWISDSLKNCIEYKHRLYRLSRSNPSLFNSYKQYNNRLKNIIQNAKREYYKRKFDLNANDTKSTWKSINSLIRPKTNKVNYSLSINGSYTTDESLISESFNNYFISVAPRLSSLIPPNDINPLNYVTRNPHSFVFFNCTVPEIISIINNLKSKKCSIHEIPISIYKKIVDIISPTICSLVNCSINSGIFPRSLKVARVVPIHKSGAKNELSNYRPISILPTLSKIFEKAVHKRITEFFNKFDLFYSDQYGFLSKKSTTDAIIRFTDECYDILNDRKSLISVYLDFSKAFDTIDHELLCKKLEFYGIRGSILDWFRSYMSSRMQYVQINSNKSSSHLITCGVPQGSVFGCFSLSDT